MQQKQSLELTDFMEASKARGISDEFLLALLVKRGWPEDVVLGALGDYWERVTGKALPVRTGRLEASRDAFLYLLSFATLATWASALGSMIFRFIEYWFPDPVVSFQVYNLRNAVTWQLASSAVAFPIFLLVMRAILKEAQTQPERLESGVRKWLTYTSLLFTAGGVIGDLICFLNYFLTGELTVRFVLKSLTVLVICGAIFVYYLGSLRWGTENDLNRARRQSFGFASAAAVVVVAAFCVGLGLAGSPSTQRHLEADQHRVRDLKAVAYSIHARFTPNATSRTLPSSLAELVNHGISVAQQKDPETGEPYQYRPLNGASYELCAVFAAPTERNAMPADQFWQHGNGRTCFTRNAEMRPAWSHHTCWATASHSGATPVQSHRPIFGSQLSFKNRLNLFNHLGTKTQSSVRRFS